MACPKCGCKVTYQISIDDADDEYDKERCSACNLVFYQMDALEEDDDPAFPPNPIIHRCGPSDCLHDYQGNIPIVNEEGRITGGTAICTKCGCTAYAESFWQ